MPALAHGCLQVTYESLNRLTIIGAGILAIVVFGGLSVRHNIPVIEQDLTAKATKQLRQSRMSWAKIEMSGRDMTLSGVAPDPAARDEAARTASIPGVRKIENELSTVVEYVTEDLVPQQNQENPTTSPDRTIPGRVDRFRTRLTVVDGRLVLDGVVPGERQRREFVELAQDRFSVASVEVRLRAGENAPKNWLKAAAIGVEIADQLIFGEVNLVESSLHVTGITATTEGDAMIRRLIEEQLPDGYSGTAETGARSELDAVLRTAPELAQRLSRRTQTTGRADLEQPGVLGEPACQREFRGTLSDRRVLFATASDTLTADSLNLLDELALVLKRCSGMRIAIHGHTDDQGLIENNLALSQRRAESVMQHFVSRGISLGRMSAQGYGEELPLVPNETAADRATNRRIEFVFESG